MIKVQGTDVLVESVIVSQRLSGVPSAKGVFGECHRCVSVSS